MIDISDANKVDNSGTSKGGANIVSYPSIVDIVDKSVKKTNKTEGNSNNYDW